MKAKQIDRRVMLRTLAVSIGAMAVGRTLAACSDAATQAVVSNDKKLKGADAAVVPTDEDEHLPGTSTPVDPGQEVPRVPNQVWESRAKQLDAEQERLYARSAFTRLDPGMWAGKENSHEPRASIVVVDGKKKVQVKVEHVMGKNLLDAGAPSDAGKVDASPVDAGPKLDGGPKADAGPAIVHFITSIFIRASVGGKETVVGLWEFTSTDAAPPTVQFTLPDGVTAVTAYEWCTLHGLWKALSLTV